MSEDKKHCEEWYDYKKIKGFLDLRKYKIPDDEFIKLLEMQKYLKREQDIHFSLSKENQEANKRHWGDLQLLALKYQQTLFSYPLRRIYNKEICKNCKYYDENINFCYYQEKYVKETEYCEDFKLEDGEEK